MGPYGGGELRGMPTPRVDPVREPGGLGTLFARIDNCGAEVLFETATGRFF